MNEMEEMTASPEEEKSSAGKSTDPRPDAAPSMLRSKIPLRVIIVFALILLLQLGYNIFCFETKKTGVHGDEIWSYGLANSYYQPFVFLPPGISLHEGASVEDSVNMTEWVDGRVYHDYITVQPDQRFAYGSVIDNQKYDRHPPFFYMLLHTVSSFFPDSFSLRYAFVINCICLVINTIFLFKLSRLLFRSDTAALFLCAFYAAGVGSLSTFMFLRQYSLLTAMTVAGAYFNAKIFYEERENKDGSLSVFAKTLPFLAAANYIAFGTHYYAIAWTGILTAVMCLWLLARKRIKKMLIYGLSVLGTLGLFVLSFPAAIRHFTLTSSMEPTESKMGWLFNFKLIISMLCRYNIGFSINPLKTEAGTVVFIVLVVLLAIGAPAAFLFRKEKWFIGFCGKCRDKSLALVHTLGDELFIIFLAADVIAMALFVNWQTDAYYYNDLITRYIFELMPFVCIVFLALLKNVITLLPLGRKTAAAVTALLCTVLVIRTNVLWPCPYFFRAIGDTEEISTALSGRDCLLIMPGDSTKGNQIEEFPAYIRNCDNVYPILSEEVLYSKEDILSGDHDISALIVPTDHYLLSDAQLSTLRERAMSYGYENVEEMVMTRHSKNAAEKEDPDGIGLGNRVLSLETTPLHSELLPKNMMVAQIADEILEENGTKDDFLPQYLISLNGSNYLVFIRN